MRSEPFALWAQMHRFPTMGMLALGAGDFCPGALLVHFKNKAPTR